MNSPPTDTALDHPHNDTTPTTEIEAECRRLIALFAHHLDQRRFREVAALFTEDGVWRRRGQSLRGPERILEFLEQREVGLVERHLMTTTLVAQLTESTCAAVSYATIFRAEQRGSGPPTVAGPVAMGDFHDRFRLTEDGWRFAYRTSEAAFAFGDAS